ncbi:hypothetical protein C8R45DRAFT_348263 [Mycena sanguinolenta]|nr:hypothetical protein C8R45DRAFT_348263 [Mycena sanguinolenta]
MDILLAQHRSRRSFLYIYCHPRALSAPAFHLPHPMCSLTQFKSSSVLNRSPSTRDQPMHVSLQPISPMPASGSRAQSQHRVNSYACLYCMSILPLHSLRRLPPPRLHSKDPPDQGAPMMVLWDLEYTRLLPISLSSTSIFVSATPGPLRSSPRTDAFARLAHLTYVLYALLGAAGSVRAVTDPRNTPSGSCTASNKPRQYSPYVRTTKADTYPARSQSHLRRSQSATFPCLPACLHARTHRTRVSINPAMESSDPLTELPPCVGDASQRPNVTAACWLAETEDFPRSPHTHMHMPMYLYLCLALSLVMFQAVSIHLS